MLDLRIRLALFVAARTGRVFRPDVPLEHLRYGYRHGILRYGVPDPGGVVTRDVSFAARDGAVLAARLYRREDAGDEALPLLVFFHGGGWVIGDVAGYDHLCRFFAHEGRIAVLSVEYRLGPEFRFPVAHEDGFDAYAYATANAAALGAYSARIAVGGDSAGGGIAAAISAYAGDRGLPPPVYQFLIYPSVDGTQRFPSAQAQDRGLPLSREVKDFFVDRYFSAAGEGADPLTTTLDQPHPERNPPTYLLGAGYDLLRDEGKAYAERLRAAGVPVTYDLRRPLPHGLITYAGIAPAARHALRDGIRATGAALAG